MKKYALISLILLVILACTITFPDDNFDSKTSTQVAKALTATALNVEINQAVTQTVAAQEIKPPDATATETPSPDDPKKELGQPIWSDNLSTGQYWSLDSGDVVIDTTTFSLDNGKLSVSAGAIGKGNNWWLTYLSFQDAYLEAKFDVGDCSGDDQYGLVFRAPEYDTGVGYYFHVTCNGHYDVRRWTESGSTMLLGMPSSENIKSGPDQSNILGVWIKGSTIKLYINDHLLEEINDSSINNDGHFGIFINARQTPGLTISLDEISYWTLN